MPVLFILSTSATQIQKVSAFRVKESVIRQAETVILAYLHHLKQDMSSFPMLIYFSRALLNTDCYKECYWKLMKTHRWNHSGCEKCNGSRERWGQHHREVTQGGKSLPSHVQFNSREGLGKRQPVSLERCIGYAHLQMRGSQLKRNINKSKSRNRNITMSSINNKLESTMYHIF